MARMLLNSPRRRPFAFGISYAPLYPRPLRVFFIKSDDGEVQANSPPIGICQRTDMQFWRAVGLGLGLHAGPSFPSASAAGIPFDTSHSK